VGEVSGFKDGWDGCRKRVKSMKAIAMGANNDDSRKGKEEVKERDQHLQGRQSLWDRGTCPPICRKRRTSMVMSPQYFRSDVV